MKAPYTTQLGKEEQTMLKEVQMNREWSASKVLRKGLQVLHESIFTSTK